jgi:hypothetical protein
MENINTNNMELNNEETVETTNVADTVIENTFKADDEVIIAEVDSGDTLKTVLKIMFVGGVAAVIAIAANWDKMMDKRYEKLQKKLSKEAAKRGEIVFITKGENGVTEDVEESTEVEATVEG